MLSGADLSLAVDTCRRRLGHLGVEPEGAAAGCEISWFGPARVGRGRPGAERVVQAMAGLMSVHGRDDGRPRPMGLEVASVAAGVLAAQGVLASLVGEARGRPGWPVRTSVLQAGLLACSHYVAAATSGQDPWPAPPAPDPGPPFCSADGRWFEIETLDPEAWRGFWQALGAGGADLGRAWTRFRARYFQGACSLPPGFHQATQRHQLSELVRVAGSCRVSLSPLRSYGEVLADVGEEEAHPLVAALEVAAGGASAMSTGSRAVAPAGAGGLPLEGLVVVEATTRMQGPLAGLLLPMLGARVVKVEPPGGDVGRMMAPLAGDNGTFFSCWNRGKETVELDLASPDGRAQLTDLVKGADVFLHNWRPGRADAWGLGPDALGRRRPGLVYVQASGWGARPERERLLGTDFLVQAFAGLGDGLAPAGQAPRTSRVLLTDFMGALVTCEGALAGLHRRYRDGVGALVGTSLLAGGLALEAHVLDAVRAGCEVGRRAGRPVWGPLDLPVPVADGELVVEVGGASGGEQDGLARLAQACGVEAAGRGRGELEALVLDRLSQGRGAEWEERLAAAGIPAARVRQDLAGLAVDPALAGLFEPLGGTSVAPASPWGPE